MEFKDNIPIYIQIEGYIYRQIVKGNLNSGDKLPSVRQLSVDLTVNVNTVQRALRELVNQGIIYTKRGEGNFITENQELIEETRRNLIDEELDNFVTKMRELGVDRSELKKLLEEYFNK